ncbi:MAG: cyclopropane-fatty-acyl-phospholipid synthase family protein [Gammaproteobacteria bacterium]|nr:cyclopropane-fatty-acyl-phospholipid synthase family protein [Gammaproteobacteria bacterium]
MLVSVLRRFMRHGNLTLIDAEGRRHAICDREGPTVVMRVTDRATERRLATSRSVWWGEAYMDGRFVIEEGSLRDFLEIYIRSERSVLNNTLYGEVQRLLHSLFASFSHYNPVSRARRNVAHHYDLSGELYDQFLDADRQYSCAYFARGDESLDTAQLLKKRHIAAKLDIHPGMQVLDIGSGWGGMAIYLATHLDCQVTGVTLSEEQYQLSRRRVEEAGLQDRVRFELRDYRSLQQSFDRVVSVGMLEHVGQFHYHEYFRKLQQLLKPDGVALIHTIGRQNKPQPVSAWIRKYIFPGGYLPAASQLSRAIESSGLWMTDLEILRLHYALTLNHWYRRFIANRERVRQLYDERFCRMWELYLLGSEMIFRHQDVCVYQMQLTRDVATLPLTRDYIYQAEQTLARVDGTAVAPNARGKQREAARRRKIEVV